jgi:predicted permease
MNIPLKQGRDFNQFDDASATPVAIVNDSMAARYWPGQNAVGKRFQFAGERTYRRIVGVVKTANYQTLGEAPQPALYVPLRQSFSDSMTLFVRTDGDPSNILVPVQRELRSLAPDLNISDVRTGGKIIDQALWWVNMAAWLLALFGVLALGLASVGLYGLMAYSVNQRVREIGVRMALGAARGMILGMVIRQGMSLVGVGLALGLGAALLLGGAVSKMVYGASVADPISLAAAVGVLVAVSAAACYLPALRATRVDPVEALRVG